jgi:hypothetical protein
MALPRGLEGRQAHWRDLGVKAGAISRAHLGYQRWPEDREGRWILRTYRESRYRIEPLGRADDVREADGESVLSYEQANTLARARVGGGPHKQDRMTVRQAFERYIEYKKSQGQPTRDLLSRGSAHILTTSPAPFLMDKTARLPDGNRGQDGLPQYIGAPGGFQRALKARRYCCIFTTLFSNTSENTVVKTIAICVNI